MTNSSFTRNKITALAWGMSTFALCSALHSTAFAQELGSNQSASADQDDAGTGIETIIVTAQKRSESLQETPLAISAFTSEGIAKRGLADIQQVAQLAPNVTFDFTSPISGASNAASVYIRGIGQSDFALTTDAGVGTYVDGVYVSRSLGGVLDVLDVERIEVLRGPQGTLFGRNTIGGAISIITKEADPEFGGSIETQIGDAGRRYLRAAVSVPLGPDTGLRLSLSSKDRNGFVNTALTARQQTELGQTALTDLGNENRQAARAVLSHRFSDRLQINLAADLGRVRENNAGSRLVGITNGMADGPLVFVHNTFTAPGLIVPGFPDGLYNEDNYITGNDTTFATGPNGTRLDSWGVSLTTEFEATDTLTVKSITAYRETDGSFARDADGSPLTITHTSNYGYEHKQFSQELQFVGTLAEDRIKYATGLYYFRETGSDPLIVDLPADFGRIFQDVADIENDSYAAFAQVTGELTQALSVTVGARYTEDNKMFRSDQYLLTGPVAPIVLGAPAGIELPLVPRNSVAEQSFSDFSPRVSLDYKFDDALIYASYSRGFKSGGFNLRYVAPRPGILPFDPEVAETFEAGFKIDAFDRKVRLNLAAFYTDYTNIQVTVFENLGAPVTLNAGDATIKGFEAELAVIPVYGLEFNANIGYLDAAYTEIRANSALVSTPEQVIDTDTRLPNAPEWQGTISGSYTHELESGAEVDIRSDLQFSSSVANDAQNSRFLNQSAYQILGVSAGYRSTNDVWNARVFVQNVTNERYIVSGDSNFGIGFHEANFNRPREWGVILGFNF